jgi:hypothetical protein
MPVHLSQLMLPESEPRIRRLVVFAESDWELLGECFDEMQFRAMLVGVLTHSYCNWLRSKGIETKEQRIASGLTMIDFVQQAHQVGRDHECKVEETLTA